MKTAVGTVLYKADKEFLESFIKSINCQNDQLFDLLIVNDNAEKSDMEYVSKHISNNLVILDAEKDSLPYQNRIDLLRMAKNAQYDLLILIDYDDIMNGNRVYEYKRQYDSRFAFFYTNLKIKTGEEVFQVLPETVKWGDILEFNFLGLSNTGVNLEQWREEFIDSLSAGNTSVFDWYMYERILLEHKVGKRINNTWTEYRIYENNIAGICQSVRKEIEVKKEHYALLKDFHQIYNYLYEQYLHMDESGVTKKEFYNGYWWEKIKLLERNMQR